MAKRDQEAEYWQSRKTERTRRSRERKSAKVPAEKIDLERALANLRAADEAARAQAARELCPCRTGWNVFEQNLDTLRGMTKDPSPLVRANALHVFEDAFELESEGLPTTPQMFSNEMVARRNRMRWRPDADQDSTCGEGRNQRRWKQARR